MIVHALFQHLSPIGFHAIINRISTLKSQEKTENLYCDMRNYEIYKRKVYSKLSCLLSHPREIRCLFIYLSFMVKKKKSVKGCFWLLVLWDLNY